MKSSKLFVIGLVFSSFGYGQSIETFSTGFGAPYYDSKPTTNQATGDILFDGTEDSFYGWSGTQWLDLSASAVSTIGTVIDSGTRTGKGASISGTEVSLETADDTNPGLVSSESYEELDISSSGDFHSAQPIIRIAKVGAVVILTGPSLGHTSSLGSAASASGFLPSQYRPDHDTEIAYGIAIGSARRITIDSDGTITFAYYKDALVADTRSNTGSFSVSWVVDQ